MKEVDLWEHHSTSPVWIRPKQLCKRADEAAGKQIVGHTPLSKVTEITNTPHQVYVADTWSTDSLGNEIGDQSFILFNGSELKVIK